MKNLLVLGILFGAISAGGYGGDSGIFSFKVGQFEVFMLVESERDGNAGILTGSTPDVIERYIPSSGFKHSTNAYLVKAPGQNILIDTGTGAGGVIIEKIKSLGVQPESVNVILLTHLHGDHFGGLVKDGKAVFPNAKIYLSERELNHFTVTSVNQAAVNALAPYRSRMETFVPSELSTEIRPQIIPGIIPIAAYGHTPGHTMYLLESGRAKLLVVGDILHVALVQFHLPAVNATYDMNGTDAARSRLAVLTYAALNRLPIAGMHIVYPGIGIVESYNNGRSFNYTSMDD